MMIREIFKTFFQTTPALPFSLFVLFGSLLGLGIYSALIPAILLFLLCTNPLRFFFILVGVSSFLWVQWRISFPQEETTGIGIVHVSEMKEAKRGFLYRGKLLEMVDDKDLRAVGHGVGCSLFSNTKQQCDHDFIVHGVLKKGSGGIYFLKTKEEWVPLKQTFSLANWRYEMKKRVEGYIKKEIHDRKSALFLIGLATGELKNSALLKAFEKRGLLHLLAISGFHFAMIALTFHFLFRLIFPPKINAFLLIVLLTLYFVFIGFAPSVARAWMVASIALVGILFEKRAKAINSLSLALILSVLFFPITLLQAGFQLSYLATAGILFFFSPLEQLLRALFPKKGNAALDFLRNTTALGLAVHLAIVPHLLSIFHKMPWHGLIYNLFFPALVTISLILLITGGLLHLLWPFLGHLIHNVNALYTQVILEFLELPLFPHQTWYVEKISSPFLAIYLTLLFGGAIFLRSHLEQRKEEELIFI